MVIIIVSDLTFKNRFSYVCKTTCEVIGFFRPCKYTLMRDLKMQFC